MNETTHEQVLLRRAALARDRLLTVVDRLDAKRQKLTHPPLPPKTAVIAIGALLAGGALVFTVAKLKHRRALPRAGVLSKVVRAIFAWGVVEVVRAAASR